MGRKKKYDFEAVPDPVGGLSVIYPEFGVMAGLLYHAMEDLRSRDWLKASGALLYLLDGDSLSFFDVYGLEYPPAELFMRIVRVRGRKMNKDDSGRLVNVLIGALEGKRSKDVESFRSWLECNLPWFLSLGWVIAAGGEGVDSGKVKERLNLIVNELEGVRPEVN